MGCNFSKINCLKPVTAVFSAAALLFSFCGCEDYLAEIEHDAPERALINTEHIYQTDNWPTGCESVTAVMALNAAGIEISVDDFIDDYLVCTGRRLILKNPSGETLAHRAAEGAMLP